MIFLCLEFIVLKHFLLQSNYNDALVLVGHDSSSLRLMILSKDLTNYAELLSRINSILLDSIQSAAQVNSERKSYNDELDL